MPPRRGRGSPAPPRPRRPPPPRPRPRPTSRRKFRFARAALRPPPPPKSAKGKAGAKGDKPSGRDETKDLAPVKGLGSQNFADADKGEAKAKFAEIMKQKVAEREAKLGFELDADDIKELEKAQRLKYCGPQGLIGPC